MLTEQSLGVFVSKTCFHSWHQDREAVRTTTSIYRPSCIARPYLIKSSLLSADFPTK